ncbi:MAG TPA: glycosyltransferase [Terriglobales bacterium]|nr:glycosyltransferase [Terriglobales bacterium]
MLAARGPVRVLYANSADDVGGGEKWMLALAQGLDRARYASTFVVAHEGRFADEIRRRGFEATAVDQRRLVSPGALLALARHFRRVRPHLVHTAGARAGFYGRVAARIAGVPAIVSSVHTSIADYEVAAWRRALYATLDRASARFATRLIATSEAIAADVVRRRVAPPGKVVTIPNRPDPRLLHPGRPRVETRRELGVADDVALIGVIARFTEQKGVADFLDALARLPPLPAWRAVLVGEGPLRAALERRARERGVADRCRFVGIRTDLGDLLAAFDLLVIPSRSEGLPYLLLEAMTVGTPLVATAVGGIPEAVTDGETGTLVPARAPERLADAMTAVLRDPAAARARADAARRHAADAFSLDAMLRAVDGVYRAALAAGGLVAE